MFITATGIERMSHDTQASPSQADSTGAAGMRQHLVNAYERETATTLRVLRAYPEDQGELRPHPRAKTARELAWMFPSSQMLGAAALRGEDIASIFRPAPDTLAEVSGTFAGAADALVKELRTCDDAAFERTVRFFTAPKTLGDIPIVEFLWFLLHDHIHHRGQFSIYLRMAGGKV